MKKNVMANVPNKMKVIVTALLAILVIAGLLPVGFSLFAKADDIVGQYTYASLPEITVNGTTGNVQESIKRNEFGKYTYNGQTYVFKAVRDIAKDETVTVSADGKTIMLAARDGEAIADNLAGLVVTTKDGGIYTLTLKPDTLLEAGKQYVYVIDGKSYSFTPSQNIGYTAADEDNGDVRTDTVNPKSFSQSGAGNGAATITIDTEKNTLSVSAKQYTRKIIYHETNDFSAGKVYLVGAKTSAGDNKMNIITLKPESTYNLTTMDTGSNSSACVHYGQTTETVVTYSLLNQWNNYKRTRNNTLVQFQGSGSTSPYNTGNGVANSITTNGFNYYFEDDGKGDTWVNSELKTQAESNTFSSGNIMMAYDADKKNYTQDRVFGSINTTSASDQSKLHFHKDCFGSYALVIEHNNGNIWTYSAQSATTGNKYGYMANGNTLSTDVLQALNGNPNLYYGVSTAAARDGDTPLTGTRSTSSPIYLFEKKTVYTQDTIESTEKAAPEMSGTGLSMTGHALRNVKATLDYEGARVANGTGAEKQTLKDKQFTVTYTLTDFDGLPVNGDFVLGGFTDGNDGTKNETIKFVGGRLESDILQKDNTYIEFENGLPEGFVLTPTIVEVSKTNDADRGNYTFMQGPEGASKISGYPETYVANGTAVTVDGDEDIRLDVRDPKREVDIRLAYSANGTLKNKDFTLTLYMKGPDGSDFNGTLQDLQGNSYTFTDGKCTERTAKGASTASPITLHNAQVITLTGVENGSAVYADVAENLKKGEGEENQYDYVASTKSGTQDLTKEAPLVVTESKTTTNTKHIQINVDIEKMDMTLTLRTDHIDSLSNAYGAGAYIDIYKNGYTNLLKRVYISDARSGGNTILRSKVVTITIPDIDATEDVYVKIYARSLGSQTGEYAKVFINDTNLGLATSDGKTDAAPVDNLSSIFVKDSSYTGKDKSIVGASADLTRTNTFIWGKNSEQYAIAAQLPHQSKNEIRLAASEYNDKNKITITQLIVHGNNQKNFPVSLRLWADKNNSGQIRSGRDYLGSLGAYDFKTPSDTSETDIATTFAPSATLKTSGTSSTVYYTADIDKKETALGLSGSDSFDILLPYRTVTPDAINYLAVASDGAFDWNATKKITNSGYITKYALVDQYGSAVFDSPYTSASVSGPRNTGLYRKVISTNGAKTVYVFRDIIPQEVKVTLATASGAAKNHADKERLFKVKVVLYRDTGEYAEGESYQVLTQSISDCNNEPEQFLVNNAETTFDGRNGAEFTLSDGDSIYLQLPWGYRAEVVSTDAQASYSTSYETREERFDTAGTGYTFTNAVTKTDGNTVIAAATDYDISKDDDKPAVTLAANQRITDQEIKVIKTRNAVPDDIGLFGGKANKAFLALVATLTTIAVAAYIYSKRYTETED